VGMTGRFSEGRAREIKEMRELQADLEAVKEGEKAWGLGRGARRSGGAKDEKKEVEDIEDEGEGKSGSAKEEDDESEDEDEDVGTARARRKNDLAFLGDEESSDDD